MTKGTHKRISQACKNGARKAKTQNEQRLQRNARDHTKAFSSYLWNEK